MEEKLYILKRPWVTTFGQQYILYLGYNENNRIDSVLEKEHAKQMTKEDCESWLLILTDRHLWSMEEVVPETPIISEDQPIEETLKENNNEAND